MKKFAFSLLFALFATISFAQVGPTGSTVIYPTGSDPCENPSIAKSFGVLNISTATTTELVPAVTGKTVYLCAFKSTVAGTAPSVLFKTGTKVSTACDTGATSQSGTYLPPTGTFFGLSGDGPALLTGALSGELCLTSGGTTPSIQGNFVYVQQ
jgi:hypothetical protein